MAFVDLETTGLAPHDGAEILELGSVLVDPGAREVRTLATLVRPSGPIPPAIARLTGIRPEEAAAAPSLAEVRALFREALAERAIVAHNAAFERVFLGRFLGGGLADAWYLDTQDLLAVTHPDAPDLRLETFTRSLLDTEERHRALDDALDTARVVSRAAAGGADPGGARADPTRRYAAARDALEAFAPDSPWLALLAKGDATARGAGSAFVAVGETREAPVPFDEEAIAAVLRDGERGRRHWPGYRVREPQVELARRFVRLLREGGTLLCEGGTGVGKSLAYLAAAIPFAMEQARDAARRGERSHPVVVSTRTKLLQDQLLAKDIPSAARFLGWPALRALSIKGRANYVCERRLVSVLAEGREPRIFAEDRFAYAVLAACAEIRPHGEVGSIGAAWLRRQPLLGELLRRSVAARAEQCSREQCAQHPGCPLGRRRAALGQAHLVVANHDLLLRWPPDYPPFAHAIVDEVHELADVADEVYALSVRPDEVLDRLDDVFGRPDATARGGAGDSLLPATKRRALRKDAVAWRRAIQQELAALGHALEPLAGEWGEVQVPEHPPAALADAARAAELAAQRVEAAAREIDDLVDPEAPNGPLARTPIELRAVASALRLAFAGAEDSVAAFEGVEPPWDRWRLAVRLVSPVEPFREHFLARLTAFAGVSASVFVDGDSFAALGELGIDARRAPPAGPDAGVLGRLDTVSVPSPFPYAEHMRVVALPDPGDLVAETAAVLAELARRLGGRTLGLFTSLRRMQDVAAELAERLRDEGIEVLAPRRAGDDPGALVARFAQGGAVLLGARRFWQGLDLPG
ncbi:MAG TPA: exonuclease domain-containing protein, partial [Myxococcota bacterium]|nr:exonuclease domain-containing protein [Myxococcota bacterium]